MINVTAFAFTGYPVTDIAKSRAFYEGLFGLKPTITSEHDGKFWIEYTLGDATLALTTRSDRWKPASDGPALACEVSNLDATITELRAAGVHFVIDAADGAMCRFAVVLDPSGNSLALHQRNSPSPTLP